MAGIFGNLHDRLGLAGLKWPMSTAVHHAGDPVYAVRDWLHFEIRSIGFDWPVFNIADSLLVCGALMLFWHALWRESKLRAEAQALPSGKPAE
jgi:signal peptidase II